MSVLLAMIQVLDHLFAFVRQNITIPVLLVLLVSNLHTSRRRYRTMQNQDIFAMIFMETHVFSQLVAQV